MLFSRCLSGGSRKFMPDAIMNAYAIGELGEEDGSAPQAVPDLSGKEIEVYKSSETLPEAPKEAPKEIEHEKSPGYEEFCQKHLCDGEKVAYVRKIAQATSKTEAQIINSAACNEPGFLTALRNGNQGRRIKRKRAGAKPLQQHCPRPPKAWRQSLKLFYRRRRSRRRKRWILIDDLDRNLNVGVFLKRLFVYSQADCFLRLDILDSRKKPGKHLRAS